MPTSPSIVPNNDDRDVYLVLDDLGGRLGCAWRETDAHNTDLERSFAICSMGSIPTRSASLVLIRPKAGRRMYRRMLPANFACDAT